MEEETRELMKEYDLDEDTAERVQGWIDAGLEEDIAVEIAENVL